MQKLTGWITLGALAISHVSDAAYSQREMIRDMPGQTQSFMDRLNRAGNQAQYMQSLSDSRRGMRVLENYYRTRHENFMDALNRNLTIIQEAEAVIAEASRGSSSNPAQEAVAECLKDDRDWKEMRRTFVTLNGLTSYAEQADVYDRRNLDSDVQAAYTKMGTYLNLNDGENSIVGLIDDCCRKLGAGRRKDVDICSEDHVKDKLTGLAKLQPLPYRFVDPMNPGPHAENLSPEDIVAMMSMGQMQDFITANDYGAQIRALQNADNRCYDARDEALSVLKRRGEMKSVMQTSFNALQCSMGFLARNWGKTGRQISLAVVKGQFPIFNAVSSCPQPIQDAAAMMLTYPPEAARADLARLNTLPSNIMTNSLPVAKPFHTTNLGDELVLSMQDEAGFSTGTYFISGQLNPATAAAMNPANNGQNSLPVQVGNGGNGQRALVRGLGEARGNNERVLVRTLASKASEGDLDSARSLAGATRSRKEQLGRSLARAKGERTLASNRKQARASAARGLATKSVIVDATLDTAKTFSNGYRTLVRAVAGDEESGRTVERPGSGTGPTNSGGSTTTSQLPNYSDRLAKEEYKREQMEKGLVQIKASLRNMAEGINQSAAALNRIIVQKKALLEKFQATFDPSVRYKELSDLGMDARQDKLISMNKTWANYVKQLNSLNTQEMGMRAVLGTSKMSFQNFIAAASAFQGLDVRTSSVRAPASTNPMFPGAPGAPGQPGQFPQLGPTPGGSVVPPGMMPPAFNPTIGQPPMRTVMLDWLNIFAIPTAHADAPSANDQKKKLVAEFVKFVSDHDDYIVRMSEESIRVRQEAWERYILNEREMRKESLLSSEARVIMGAFNDSVREEVPDLIKARNASMAAGTNPAISAFIEQIRRDSTELGDLLLQEATLSLDTKPTNPADDDESWTGMLPAISLQ